MQQNHKAVFESWLHAFDGGASEKGFFHYSIYVAYSFVQDEPHTSTLRNCIDYPGVIQQWRLEFPGLAPRRRLGEKNPAGGQSTHIARATLRQYLSLMHHNYVVTSLRLIQIGGAEQHRQTLIFDEL